MFGDDPPIPPIPAVGSEPIEPPDVPLMPARPARPARPFIDPSPTSAAALSDEVDRSELRQSAHSPSGVTRRATVHDAALHGSKMAQAIEAAASNAAAAPPGTTGDVNDRAQQLGGAMASASSGQATPHADAVDIDAEVEDRVDPLAPIAELEAQTHRRDRRNEEEHRLDADIHP